MTWSDIAALYSSKTRRSSAPFAERRWSDRFGISRWLSVSGSYGATIVFLRKDGTRVSEDILASGYADPDSAFEAAIENLTEHVRAIRKSIAADDPISWEDVYYLDYEWSDLTFSSKEELELKLSVVV